MNNANPPYIHPLGAGPTLSKPPFDLSQVMMRVFPLRANYHSLQLFCDRFLNIAPEFSHVEPAAPFVLFCVINYGHMSNAASNVGYTSQNEVIFAVPLNWYRIIDGKRVLQNNASISPFIWVDKPLSAWVGREVYGWPKSLAWLKGGVNEWARDPTAPQTMFSLEALLYRQLFAAERQEPGVLLEVQRKTPPGLFEFPQSPMNPLNPWLSWPRAVLESIGLGGNLLETFTRLPAFGFPSWGDGASIVEMMSKAFGEYNPFGAMPASNTLNLKQFRDPSHPQSISYQAIVNSEMTPKSYRRGGLLGEGGLLRGELSGGYEVLVHRYPAWPIIEALGLQVSRETRGEDRRVAVLEPVLPFWVELDYEYGKGEVVCWRGADWHWRPGPEPEPEREPSSMPLLTLEPAQEIPEALKDARVEDFSLHCDVCGTPHLYNTAEGSAVEQVYGPFFFPDATVRVLPLLADWDRLRKATDARFNFPDGSGETLVDENGELAVLRVPPVDEKQRSGESEKAWTARVAKAKKERQAQIDLLKSQKRLGMPLTPETATKNLFVPWGNYVYLMVTNYEEMTSELNIGWWARRRVAFAYPVKWFQWVGDMREDGTDPAATPDSDSPIVPGHWELKSFGMAAPFMYVDTPTAATVGREMNGWSVAQAKIDSPETDWLVRPGGTSAPNLMSLSTDVVPALNANQEAVARLLLQITTEPPAEPDDDESWKEIASIWGERQVIEARTKALEALSEGDPYTEHGHWDGGWPPRRRLQWLKSTAMEVLFRGAPVNLLSMKQFRDAENPNDACYQALNVYPESITRVHDMRPIDEPLYVGIHRYPTAPIVDMLGLDVKWKDNSEGQPIEYVQAIRPFWIRADVKAELGKDFAFRAGSETWTNETDKHRLYFDRWQEPAAPVFAAMFADREPKEVQDFGSERLFRESLKIYREENDDRHSWAITRGGHFDQLKETRTSFSPQVAIESILNHRWVNMDPRLEGTTLNDAASWCTLIPTESIPNRPASEWFVQNYEQLVQCIGRVYDRLAQPGGLNPEPLRRHPSTDVPLPRVKDLPEFLERFDHPEDVRALQARDTRTTTPPIYNKRLEEIALRKRGTREFVGKIKADLKQHLNSIESGALDDFFSLLSQCLENDALSKDELLEEARSIWKDVGSPESLRVLTAGHEQFWAVDPRDLQRLEYTMPPAAWAKKVKAAAAARVQRLQQLLDETTRQALEAAGLPTQDGEDT